MNAYKTYFDRQVISSEAHDRLMALEKVSAKKKTVSLQRWGALAACAALVLGIGAYSLGRGTPVPDHPLSIVQDPLASPDPEGPVSPEVPEKGILIQSPSQDQVNFYSIPGLNFTNGLGETATSIAFPDGSFSVELTLEDLQKIFWGPEGKPESYHTETGRQDLPWYLFWDGYTVQAEARYDGNGDLWLLSVYGSKDLDSFELHVSPDRLPPQCLAQPDGESTDVNGVDVVAYYQAYDRNGDGLTDHVCTSEFLVDGYGYRFRNVHSDAGEGKKKAAETAQIFNACFVMRAAQWTDSRCYFGHIAHTDDIPPWEETTFETLAQSRQRAEFAPYLPESAPGFGDFFGRLSYQEGGHNYLFVRWDDGGKKHLEVEVRLPEGTSNDGYEAAEVNAPESYEGQLFVTFHAQDLSLDVVRALENDPEKAGFSFWFHVLHENGVVVSYTVNGLTAEQVWAFVEPTLPQ